MVTGYHGYHHRKVDPYRGRSRTVELAVRCAFNLEKANQCRIDLGRQGFHRRARRQAGHEISATAFCLAPEHQYRAGVRRIRRRRPDVRFRDQSVRESPAPDDMLATEQGDQAASGIRLFSDRQHIGSAITLGHHHGTQQINQARMDRWSIVRR